MALDRFITIPVPSGIFYFEADKISAVGPADLGSTQLICDGNPIMLAGVPPSKILDALAKFYGVQAPCSSKSPSSPGGLILSGS